jgi:hypothetical protein
MHPNNIMGEEDLNPLGLHRFPPGRRMPSMMAPSVMLDAGGRVELALGSAGSNRIRSALLQVIVGVVDHGLQVADAVQAPRLHFEDGVVFAEPGIDVDALRAGGPDVSPFREPNLFFGGVAAVRRDPDSGPGAERATRGAAARRSRVRRPARRRPRARRACRRLRRRGARPAADRAHGARSPAPAHAAHHGRRRVSCNGGPLVAITSRPAHRRPARPCASCRGEEEDEVGPADRDPAPARRAPNRAASILAYEATVRDPPEGTGAWADTSPRQPPSCRAWRCLTRQIAQGACGLER